MEGKTWVRNWGDLSPELGEVAPDFDSRFGGIEATEYVRVTFDSDLVWVPNIGNTISLWVS